MTQPKFSVGEVVILQSRDVPNFNGEYTVEQILSVGEVYSCRLTGEKLVKADNGSPYAYRLFGLCPEQEKTGWEVVWNEVALRKKHQPGEMTFEGLIMSLSNPVNVEG